MENDATVFCTPCTPCFLVFVFSRKIYIYTYHLRHRHMGPCFFLCVEEKQRKSRVHGVHKTDNAMPVNVMSLPGGRVVFLWRGEASTITEYTEYRKWMASYRQM